MRLDYREGVTPTTPTPTQQPPEVYWRRRILVFVIAVLLVVGGIKIFTGGKSTAKPVASASPTASPTVSAVKPSATAPTPQASIGSSAKGTCDDSDIRLSVVMTRHVAPVGQGLTMDMVAKNISDSTCTRDLGSGANEVTITSGPALVWSTDHCNTSTASDIRSLKPGEMWKVNLIWDGHISGTGCQILGEAQHGAYWAHARNGKVMSKPLRFVVD